MENFVTYLALAIARRIQTFFLIQLKNMDKSPEGIYVKIISPIEAPKWYNKQPTLFLPFLSV